MKAYKQVIKRNDEYLSLYDASPWPLGQTRTGQVGDGESGSLFAYSSRHSAAALFRWGQLKAGDRRVVLEVEAEVAKVNGKLYCSAITPLREIGDAETDHLRMTVCYRKVKGAAKAYPYCGAKLYRAEEREDGQWTYRPLAEFGPDRRSEILAHQDAAEWAETLGVEFEPGIRLGTSANYRPAEIDRDAIYSNDEH